MKYFMLPEARHVKVVARGVCWPGDDSIQQSLLQKKKRQIKSEKVQNSKKLAQDFHSVFAYVKTFLFI